MTPRRNLQDRRQHGKTWKQMKNGAVGGKKRKINSTRKQQRLIQHISLGYFKTIYRILLLWNIHSYGFILQQSRVSFIFLLVKIQKNGNSAINSPFKADLYMKYIVGNFSTSCQNLTTYIQWFLLGFYEFKEHKVPHNSKVEGKGFIFK